MSVGCRVAAATYPRSVKSGWFAVQSNADPSRNRTDTNDVGFDDKVRRIRQRSMRPVS